MAIRKILCPLTGGSRDATLLESAFEAARPLAAHVVAMFVRPDPAEAMPFFGEGGSGTVVQEIIGAAREAADKAATEARTALRAAADAADVAILERPARRGGVSASFCETQGHFSDRVVLAARLADLVVFGPLKEGDNPALTEAFDATLLEAGRAVLLVAHAPARRLLERVAIAWDASLASAHAVCAAIDYLARAESVEILTIRRSASEIWQPEDVREYLALHNVSCTCRAVDAGARPVGEVLLEAAANAGARMLVLGGYGHSRLRQLFVSSVTRHVVSHTDMPLFLVH